MAVVLAHQFAPQRLYTKLKNMEIEIRAEIGNDIKKIEQDIIDLGAKLKKQKEQVDKYFGEISLFKKVGYSFLMRIRNEGDKKFLTYKGAESKIDGVWEEYEFSVDDEKKAEAMLKAMGLEEIIVVKKNRTEYTLDNLTICLDTIDGLGNFIEIESQDNDDVEKERLHNLMEKLNIRKEQIIHKGYVTMLLIKNNSPYSEYIIN